MVSIGIDSSRCRSGGSKAHLIGILSNFDPAQSVVSVIHIWSYQSLLDSLPDKPWLVKHNHLFLEGSIILQLFWQFFLLPFYLLKSKCDILFTADTSSMCLFSPSVVFNQDILAYEPLIVKKYRYRSSYFRLIFIKYIQNICISRSSGVIFLSKYSSALVQSSLGSLPNYVHIPHGIDDSFRLTSNLRQDRIPDFDGPINFLYISNTDFYKNQPVVVSAVNLLRSAGYNVTLELIGGGCGPAQLILENLVNEYDPYSEFIKLTPFVDHSTLPAIIANADVFVFASSVESWGITLAEAMAVGLPILCSNRSSLPEVLGDTGIYFDPDSALSLYYASLHLFSHPNLFYELPQATRSRAASYTWHKCANLTFDFILSTLLSL